MTGTNRDLFTHKSSRSYLNHLVFLILFVLNLKHFSVIYEFEMFSYIHTYAFSKSKTCHKTAEYRTRLLEASFQFQKHVYSVSG
jgi:hypothetical protein